MRFGGASESAFPWSLPPILLLAWALACTHTQTLQPDHEAAFLKAAAAIGPPVEAAPSDATAAAPSAPSATRSPHPPSREAGPLIRRDGFTLVAPYPLDNLMRGFKGCRKGKRVHPAVDIGGVGPNWGLGTPVRSMVRARVERIGLPTEQPELYGVPDTRPGTARRSGRELPRSLQIPGYGQVHFFTRNYGRWRSGTTIILRGLDGGLQGYRIRYMHLGAVHPGLRVGQIVQAGEEIGLMGCTAIKDSPPHIHLDAVSPDGDPLDLKAIFTGRPRITASCPMPPPRKAQAASRQKGKASVSAAGKPGRGKSKASVSRAGKPGRGKGKPAAGPTPAAGKARLQR